MDVNTQVVSCLIVCWSTVANAQHPLPFIHVALVHGQREKCINHEL